MVKKKKKLCEPTAKDVYGKNLSAILFIRILLN